MQTLYTCAHAILSSSFSHCLSMKLLPVVVLLFLIPHEVHPHSFQLCSEAMFAPQPVAPPGGVVAAVLLVKALGSPPSLGPWPGH